MFCLRFIDFHEIIPDPRITDPDPRFITAAIFGVEQLDNGLIIINYMYNLCTELPKAHYNSTIFTVHLSDIDRLT
jgi:hypothetical protein